MLFLSLIVCPEGRFGFNCDQVCDCAEGIKCDVMSGACVCADGRTGRRCDRCKYGFTSTALVQRYLHRVFHNFTLGSSRFVSVNNFPNSFCVF